MKCNQLSRNEYTTWLDLTYIFYYCCFHNLFRTRSRVRSPTTHLISTDLTIWLDLILFITIRVRHLRPKLYTSRTSFTGPHTFPDTSKGTQVRYMMWYAARGFLSHDWSHMLQRGGLLPYRNWPRSRWLKDALTEREPGVSINSWCQVPGGIVGDSWCHK